MNYFQLYETERKHLKVGARWICVNPDVIRTSSPILGEIVEIVNIYSDHTDMEFKVLSGSYKNIKFTMYKQWFIKGYKPYTYTLSSDVEVMVND